MMPSTNSPNAIAHLHDDPTRFSPTRAEQLFRRLDDQKVNGPLGVVKTRVYGVMEEGDDLWVQLSVGGAVSASALLRVKLEAEPADAFRAVEKWIAGGPDDSATHDRIIEVGSVAALSAH